MPVYEYKALNQKGKSCKGLIDADNESKARSKLKSSGKFPISLQESLSKGKNNTQGPLGSSLFERIKTDEIRFNTAR